MKFFFMGKSATGGSKYEPSFPSSSFHKHCNRCKNFPVESNQLSKWKHFASAAFFWVLRRSLFISRENRGWGHIFMG